MAGVAKQVSSRSLTASVSISGPALTTVTFPLSLVKKTFSIGSYWRSEIALECSPQPRLFVCLTCSGIEGLCNASIFDQLQHTAIEQWDRRVRQGFRISPEDIGFREIAAAS